MTRRKLKLYSIFDLTIAVVGVALCVLALSLLNSALPFELLVLLGLMGVIMAVLGTSLFIDLIQFRSELRKMFGSGQY
ncbi:hypothetical protein [Marinoscillum furvescens]|uniref:Uncharacterized protein n=1 Tax=Marinoscillum furvescens DSM 4134 TaxID=1122208 RepID=A0A3D9L3L9_MARFU|nr:hypothetical protein [Marinoscillum furvescens]RED99400.1 hypothetical protein C7460_10816 [Marinoscillum furvescens DSM 4134]